ncbi:MAG: octanoyltransferase, partial [Chloroflexi bacterium]|nr:octanoyltransferase [Chloroflexota bacterium]
MGRVDYRVAWALQKRLVTARSEDRIGDQLLLLEHPSVLTLGRGADETHVRASSAELERRGIEVVQVERGGEVTYHGPGQLVAYPIIALARRGLLVRP